MKITITRHNYSRYGVDGTLSIGGKRICNTCEHPEKHLPTGTYVIKIERNKKLQRIAPTFQNGAIIKPGNGPFLLADGSIIVGKFAIRGLLVDSNKYFNKLIDRLDKANNRKEEISIIIKDE